MHDNKTAFKNGLRKSYKNWNNLNLNKKKYMYLYKVEGFMNCRYINDIVMSSYINDIFSLWANITKNGYLKTDSN